MSDPTSPSQPEEENVNAFRSIFKSSNEGIIVVDEKWKIKLINPVGENMFGYQQGELRKTSINELVPQAIRGGHTQLMTQFAKAPSPRKMGEGRDLNGQKKDGSLFPIELSLSHTIIGEKHFVVVFVIDITTRKEAELALQKSEEQLITYAAELENRVSQRTHDLNESVLQMEKANAELQVQIKERTRAEDELKEALSKERELNEMKSRFVSMASHEFRTPLSSILSSVTLIQKYIHREMPEKTEKHIDRIQNSVKNLTDILNDFLNLGRLEEGIIRVELSRVELEPFLKETCEDANAILKEGQEIELEAVSLSVMTDEQILRNILINLISNATKYSEEGKKIKIKATQDEQNLVISVTDEGMGIPETEQKHLFERFFRAKNATNIQGTGLGLNIVKNYISLLKGSITYSSKLNIGTTFTLTIPINTT